MSASDIAARRIREARIERKWTVKQLAERCAKAGADQLTAAVITNLESRRKPSREVTLDEILALAQVLEVPPVQLMTPVSHGELLQVVPGEELGPMEAPGWLADDQAVLGPVRSSGVVYAVHDTLALRHQNSPLTLVRQIREVTDKIRFLETVRRRHPDGEEVAHAISDAAFAVFGVRLLHYLEAFGQLGYEPPPTGDVMEILARRGAPLTLAEWQQRQAAKEEQLNESP
jgi:transcriptional regulator with XRE-family HTH domain